MSSVIARVVALSIHKKGSSQELPVLLIHLEVLGEALCEAIVDLTVVSRRGLSLIAAG